MDDAANDAKEATPTWRDSQPPEFHSIIDRVGRERFELAFRTWAAGTALQAQGRIEHALLKRMSDSSVQLRKVAQQVHPHLRSAHGNILAGLDWLAQQLMSKLEIKAEEVQEIQRDIQRAAELAQAARQPASIILPNDSTTH